MKALKTSIRTLFLSIILTLLVSTCSHAFYTDRNGNFILSEIEFRKITLELDSKDLLINTLKEELEVNRKMIVFLNNKITDLDMKYIEKEQKLISNFNLMKSNYELKVEDYKILYNKYSLYKAWNPFRIGIYSVIAGGIGYLSNN